MSDLGGTTTDAPESLATGSPTRLFRWTPDDRAADLVPVGSEGWASLFARYDPTYSALAFGRVVDLCRDLGTRSVVIEPRYIDLDFRNEHAGFYSGTFRRYPSVCHRLHFFKSDLTLAEPLVGQISQADYLGYSVMRPLPGYPVGRTMIQAPAEIERVCAARDVVHLFGQSLTVDAVPFMSQDGQLTRCAHAVMWMVLYHMHKRHGLPRRLPGEIRSATLGGRVSGRELPSEGLSPDQMLSGFHSLSVSAPRSDFVLEDKKFRDPRDPYAQVLCPYVNSQMPPVVYNRKRHRDQPGHVWMVAGYTRSKAGRVTYFVHDDELGPYLPVSDPEVDADRGPWSYAVLPLPQKVYVPASLAEAVAEEVFDRFHLRLRTNFVAGIGQGEMSDEAWSLVQAEAERTDRRPRTPKDLRKLLTETDRATRKLLRALGDRPDEGWGVEPDEAALIDALKLLDGRHLCRRTYAVLADQFKAQASRLPAPLANAYGLAPWPRYVWVVEFLDHQLRAGRIEACVVGEVVLDATAHHLNGAGADPPLLAVNVGGCAEFTTADYDFNYRIDTSLPGPYTSGAPSILSESSGHVVDEAQPG